MSSCNIKARTFQLKPSTASAPSLAYIRAGHPHVGNDGEGIWTISRPGLVREIAWILYCRLIPNARGCKIPKNWVCSEWVAPKCSFPKLVSDDKGPSTIPSLPFPPLRKVWCRLLFLSQEILRRATTQRFQFRWDYTDGKEKFGHMCNQWGTTEIAFNMKAYYI